MASIEQRLQAVEAAINNSRITPELAELVNVLGNELITVWNPTTKSQNRYPLSEVFGSGSVDPTNDILPLFEQVPNIDFNQNIEGQIKDYINNSPQFQKTGSQIKWYFVTRLESDSNSDTGFNTIREFYLFTKGKGTYGLNSGNLIASTDIFFQFKLKDNEGTTQTISLNASSPYDIENLVNNSTPVTLSQSATIIFDINVVGQTENDYYLYVGESGITVGTGENQTSSTDFVLLNTATPDPVDTSSFITFDEAITEINNAIANITYDSTLDTNSTNAVQNNVISNKFNSENMELIDATGLDLTNSNVLSGLNNKAIFIGDSNEILLSDALPNDFNVLIYYDSSDNAPEIKIKQDNSVNGTILRNVGVLNSDTDEIIISGANKNVQYVCYPIYIQKLKPSADFTGFGIVNQASIEADESEKAIRSTLSSDQELTDGQFTILDYDNSVFDNSNVYDLQPNGRVIVNKSGFYDISAGVVIRSGLSSAAEITGLGIFVNGDLVDLITNENTLIANSQRAHSLSTQINLSDNDIVDCRAFVQSTNGGVLDFLADAIPFIFGINATRVNHLAIVECSKN